MFKYIRTRIRARIDAALEGTHNHYACYLPRPVRGLPAGVMKLFYSGITADRMQLDRIHEVPENAVIVYAGKYKSDFEYMFYHTRYQEVGLPVPEIGFDFKNIWLQPVSRIFKMMLAHMDYLFYHRSFPEPYETGYIREELLKGRVGFLFLVEKKGFQRRYVKAQADPMRHLIEMQKNTSRPVCILPHLMFFSRHPRRAEPAITDILFGTEERPGRLRRLFTLFKNPGKVFIEISEPFNLKTFLEKPNIRALSPNNQSLTLRRTLLDLINRHRQSITGPILKNREELKENILTGRRLRTFMEDYAASHNVPIYKVHKEAAGYLDEIAARYSHVMIQLFVITINWLTDTMFEGFTVNTEVLKNLKDMSRKGPLVIIPCHKSHIDYLILSYIMRQNNMPCPLIAAGKNLSFWPLGPIFRGGGAFFLRRTFKGAVLYSKVFAEYVYKILTDGFNVEFFIEGGRSRTGKLLKPKYGMLSILLDAYKEGACEDLIFAPVYIGYDRVIEEGAYLHELEGGQKSPENLSGIFKARKFLKKRYGKIYIQFHKPFSFNAFQEQYGSYYKDMDDREQREICRQLGYRFLKSIDRVTVVTPHAVVAAAILNLPKRIFTYEEFIAAAEVYMNYLFARNIKLADTLMMDYVHALEFVFEIYVHRKFIEPVAEDKEETDAANRFSVNIQRRPALDYYKNNGINYFIPAAFTALAILEKDAFQISSRDLSESYRFLRDFFINEFAYDMNKTPDEYIRQCIRQFTDEAILMPHQSLPDMYNLTSAGYRKLNLFSGFLKTYFESYLIALNVFMRYPKSFLNSKNTLKKTQSLGTRMFKMKKIERPEAVSRLNFKNAIDFFNNQDVKGSEDTERIEYFETAIQKYLKYLS